jgi:hypothetical protein
MMLFPNRGLNLSIGVTPFITIQTHRTSTGNQNRRTDADASGNRSVKSLGSFAPGMGSLLERLFDLADVRNAEGCRPRVHDLRNSFAIQSLIRVYRAKGMSSPRCRSSLCLWGTCPSSRRCTTCAWFQRSQRSQVNASRGTSDTGCREVRYETSQRARPGARVIFSGAFAPTAGIEPTLHLLRKYLPDHLSPTRRKRIHPNSSRHSRRSEGRWACAARYRVDALASSPVILRGS